MKPKVSLAIQYATRSEFVPTRLKFRKWIQAALECDAEIALRIVGMEEGRELNRDYRSRDYATNVLTFPLDSDPLLMGDIVLCAPVIEKEAVEQSKSLEAHYAHLVVHGVLHLQGYDHENDEDAIRMETLETQIVTDLGYADPYRIQENAITHG